MIDLPELAPPLRVYRGLPEDLTDIHAFLTRATTAEYGVSAHSPSFFEAMRALASFDPTHDAIVIRGAGETIEGVGIVQHSAPYVDGHLSGHVDPERLGEGIGSAIVDWGRQRVEDRIDLAPDGARIVVSSSVAQTHEPSHLLLGDHGFEISRFFLEMSVTFDDAPPPPLFPPALSVRNYRGDGDLETLYDTVRDAFRDHFGYVDRPREQGLDRFRAFASMDMWDNGLTWMAFDGAECVGNIVATATYDADPSLGYIPNLGVRPGWRGRGLARALLYTAFGELYRRGKPGVALHVDADSLTGATRLYESVGMDEVRRTAVYEREVRAGEDIRVL